MRLRAGASEKLKLSFLPFQMPPLQQQQQQQVVGPDPKAAAAAAAPKALTRSLLLLSDSDCGEFAYELCGEVLLPAPFLEHKATVGLQGQQVGYLCCCSSSSCCCGGHVCVHSCT